jgi:dipeptidyl aminopeptidase/acylaminoacyl peptidase
MRRPRFLAVVFILAFLGCTGNLVAQAKHPFTFEDMMKLKRVEEPEVSPDGKWVLFAAVDVDLAANTKTPHVWVVPLSNGATGVPPVGQEKEIIAEQDADRPRWAPDGKRFAFISTKTGGSQVWVADFDGAAGAVTGVHQLTTIKTEADGELWSPDGKNVLFRSDVYPECDGTPNEEDCNAKKLEAAEKSPVKAQIFTRLLYRHWNAYKEGKRSHLFVVSAPTLPKTGEGWGTPSQGGAGALARDLTPGDYDTPPFSLGGQDDYAFSPDGKEICYTSNHDPVEATSTNNDLWIVPVGGEPGVSPGGTGGAPIAPKNITADNKASDSTPLYSPDGKYIAYRAQQRPGYESDRFRLMLYDRKTGERKLLTRDFDNWVESFSWGSADSEIFFTSEIEGKSPLNRLWIPGVLESFDLAHYSLTYSLGGGLDSPVSLGDSKFIPDAMGINFPNEIYIMQIKSGEDCVDPCFTAKLTPLTHLNDALLSQISMSPLEPFWFAGAHGDRVEGFLVKPPNFDPSKKYPVKFLIHGGPQGAWGDDWSYRWNPELFAANGYVVVMINFHGSTGYGQKFIDAINGDWGGAPFEDLMKGLDYAEEHYSFIDKNRECALGASYGGYMANWILGHTDRFKCIISHDGMFNAESAWGSTEELWFNEWEFKGTPYTNREMYRKWSPHEYAANFKTPTLVIHGQKDYRLDVSQGFDLFTTLQRIGVPSKMLYFPDEGHWVLKPQNAQLWYKTVNDWVDEEVT